MLICRKMLRYVTNDDNSNISYFSYTADMAYAVSKSVSWMKEMVYKHGLEKYFINIRCSTNQMIRGGNIVIIKVVDQF